MERIFILENLFNKEPVKSDGKLISDPQKEKMIAGLKRYYFLSIKTFFNFNNLRVDSNFERNDISNQIGAVQSHNLNLFGYMIVVVAIIFTYSLFALFFNTLTNNMALTNAIIQN